MEEKQQENLIKFEDLVKNFRNDNFMANSIMSANPSALTSKQMDAFHKDLDDLMRKYKVIQIIAQIFAKL